MNRPPTFVMVTLGCKVNQYDSWKIARELRQLGFKELPFGSPADIYIVDTCTVTHVADQKSRKAASRARRLTPNGFVVVTGCAATLSKKGEGSKFETADLIASNEEKEGLAKVIAELVWKRWGHELPPQEKNYSPYGTVGEQDGFSEDGHCRVRAMLKVQDGCDKFCAFCIIPFTRGAPRSKPVHLVVEEARQLVELGYGEIVLTGVCLSMYGSDLDEGGIDLAHLLERLCEIDGLRRIRMSSLDPRDITPRLIEKAAQLEKVCHHFHVSLQSGDDEILQAMKRNYSCEDYRRLIDAIRDRMPDAAITTDVLVGFPAETERHFENTYRFCELIGFASMHVFKYSPRPGTVAALLPNPVDPQTQERRSHALIELSQALWQRFATQFLGEEGEVLVEKVEGAEGSFRAQGLTGNYLRAVWEAAEKPKAGSLCLVRLEALEGGLVRGRAQM